MIWSIDGVGWDIPCQILRTAEVKASDISGIMLNGAYFNDVLGTYMSYEVAIAVPWNMLEEYYQVYELLTNPVSGHTFVLPYNDDVVEFTGRVESVSDEWVYRNGNNWWKGVRFTAVSNTPSKEVDAEGIQNYGLSPFPYGAEVDDGYWRKSETGWTKEDITDGDEVRY